MAREAISGTWNEIAKLWHAKSLKIIYIMFHTGSCEYRLNTPFVSIRSTFEINNKDDICHAYLAFASWQIIKPASGTQ